MFERYCTDCGREIESDENYYVCQVCGGSVCEECFRWTNGNLCEECDRRCYDDE